MANSLADNVMTFDSDGNQSLTGIFKGFTTLAIEGSLGGGSLVLAVARSAVGSKSQGGFVTLATITSLTADSAGLINVPIYGAWDLKATLTGSSGAAFKVASF